MPINVGGIEVEIKLNNGQLVSGLIKNEELVKLTGQKIEGHMGRTAGKVQNAFSRMFGIGALIGTGLMLVRSFYGAIQNGIAKAVASNDELSGRMSRLKNSLDQMFVGLGVALLPIIDKVTTMLEQLAKYANQGYEKKIATNNEEIKKLEAIIASAQKRTNGAFGFLERKTISDAQYTIDRLKKENQAIEEQVGLLRKVATAKKEVYEKGDTERFDRSSDEFKKSTEAVLNAFGQLAPITDETAQGINKIGQAIIQISENASKFSIEALGAGGIITIFATLISLGNQLAQAINNAISESAINSQKLAIAGVTAEVEKYQSALNKLNIDLQWFKQQVETEKISYDTDTAEGIEKTVKANEKIIEQNKINIEQQKQIVANAKGRFGNDLTGAQQSIKDRMSNLEVLKAQIDAMPDKVGLFGADNETKKTLLNAYNMAKANMNADLQYLQTAIDAQTTLNGLEGENARLAKENVDLDERKADLMNEQAEAAQATADALKDQTRELLAQKAQLGLLDVENYGDALVALSQLQTAGYSGLDLLSAMSDLGFSNELSQSTRVGQIVVNNYMASNNSANIQAMLSNQFGA